MSIFKSGDTVVRTGSDFGCRDEVIVVVGQEYVVNEVLSNVSITLHGRSGQYEPKNFKLVGKKVTEQVCTELVGLREAHKVKLQELEAVRETFRQVESGVLEDIEGILSEVTRIKTEYKIV